MSSAITHRPPRHWLKISVTSPARLSELVSTELTLLTSNGTETMTVQNGIMVIAYLEKDEQYRNKSKEINNYLEQICSTTPEIIIDRATIVEENWSEQWKSQFKPTKISNLFTVTPSWEPYSPASNEKVITIDPGLAFGTGLHASTRLALLHLEKVLTESKPNSVLDVGTGTAILAIAAAMLGATPVIAVDNDPDAVEAGRCNCEQNEQNIDISNTPLADIDGQFKVVIANITADVLTMLKNELVKHMSPGGALILAGILAGGQGENIVASFSELGLTLVSEEQEGEWISYLFSQSQA